MWFSTDTLGKYARLFFNATKTRSNSRRIAFFLFIVLLSPAGYAATDDISNDSLCEKTYTDYSNPAAWHLLHSAAENTPNLEHTLRLTDRQTHQTGGAFLTLPLLLEDVDGALLPFSAYFTLRQLNPTWVHEQDGKGAEGMTLLLATTHDVLGAGGGGLGSKGLDKSIAIEFDSWKSGWDSDGNHIGINVNGSMHSLTKRHAVSRLNNGRLKHVWVDYDPATQLLSVRYSNSSHRPNKATLSLSIDLAETLDSDRGYFGFTGATGEAAQIQEVISASFRAQFLDPDCSGEVLSFSTTPTFEIIAGNVFHYDVGASSNLANAILSYELVEAPSGAVIDPVSGAIQWASSLNDVGTNVSFTVRVSSTLGATAEQSFNIAVSDIPNHAPIAQDAAVSTAEDAPAIVTLLAQDADNDELDFIIVTQPQHGHISGIAPDLTYTPDANYNGVDSFTFLASDGTLDSNTATISVDITAVNDVPDALSHAVSVIEDTAVAVTLQATDADNDPLTFVVVTPPQNGTLSGTAPDLVYTPDANFNGNDAFTFGANDGQSDSAAATISITIDAANDVPISEPQTHSIDEDNSVSIVLTATDTDGDDLSFQITVPPEHGTVTGDAPNIVYTPNPDFTGTDQFDFVSSDTESTSDAATIEITVNAVNDAPQGVSQSVNTPEDTVVNITLSGTDADSDPLAYSVVGLPSNGTLSGAAENWAYTPNENFNGSDSFTYVVNDGLLDSGLASVSINVTPVNDAPVADPATYSLDENSSVSFTLAGTDIDGDSLDFEVTQSPASGVLIGTAPDLQYVPSVGFSGIDQLVFMVSDNQLTSATATVNFTINQVNSAPIVSSEPTVVTLVDEPYVYAVLADDPDGDTLSFELVTSIAGMVIDQVTGVLNWTPDASQVGNYPVTLKVTDAYGESVEQSFELVVVSNEPSVTHEGRDFWLTFMKNFRALNQELSIFISSQTDASGYIDIPALNQQIPFSVAANSVETVVFTDPDAREKLTAGWISGQSTSGGDAEDTHQTGIHVISNNPVTVYGLNYYPQSSDGFLVLPTHALGKHHTVSGYISRTSAGGNSNQMAVVATEDNTTVSITPAHNLPVITDVWMQDYDNLYKKGETYTRSLNKGESYYLYDYVIGSTVSADKPVAVFSGNSCQSVPEGTSCDHMIEQSVPNGALGNRYYSFPLALRANGDVFNVIATTDDTVVSINDTQTILLQQGEFYETLIDGPALISANHPIMVSQFSRSNNQDFQDRERTDISTDPFIVNLVPIEQALRQYTFSTPATGFQWNFINVVINSTHIDTITLDGLPLDPTEFKPIPNTEYSGAAIAVEIGTHTINSSEPFLLTIYGYDDFDSYGYSGGLSIGNSDNIAMLEVESTSQNNPEIGQDYCIDVRAKDNTGSPVGFAPVTFRVASTHAIEDLAFTDALGIASVCYTGKFAGDDVVHISAPHVPDSTHTLTWINANPTQNHTPVITQHPSLQADYGKPYSSQVVAADVDGDPLEYTLIDSPAGMSIDSATGSITWTAPEDFARGQFQVQVTDPSGATTQQTYQLSGVDYNHAPTITSDPILTVPAYSAYSYTLESYDADRDPWIHTNHDSLRVYFEERPVGMSAISSSASLGQNVDFLNWNAGDLANTDHDVTVVVVDGRGGVARQSFTIHVTPNEPSVIHSVPAGSARVGRHYTYTLDVSDPEDNNTYYFSYVLKTFTPGMVLNRRDFSWTPGAGDIGTHNVTIEITDNAGNITEQSWVITVLNQPNIPPTFESTPPSTAWVNQPFSYTVETADADNDPTTISAVTLPAGASFDAATGVVSWIPSADQVGSVDFVLDVDDRYDTTTQSFSVSVSQDAVKPVIEITSPEQAEVITQPVSLTGSITDDQLASWRVLLQREGTESQSEIAQGTDAVVASTLATLDPTLLKNGVYNILVEATDASGNQTTEGLSFIVEGQLKVGNFSITFEDLNIPMAGVPIQVTRTYDTRQKSELGDFGYGWTIDYQNVDVQETRTPGLAWEMNEYATGPQGILTNYCVEPVGKPQVVVTLPDGKVERFGISAEPQCSTGIPIFDVTLKFTPESGTISSLEAIDSGVVRLVNSDLVVLGDNEVADPNQYKLTTKAGYVYTLDQSFGIKTVETPNGQTLTYTDNGIFHSDGKSVLFNRNSDGLIYRVTAPSGINIDYTYLTNNDLSYVRNEHSAYTWFTYNDSHALVDITGPEGHRIIRNIYDDDGRLIAQEDNDGNRTDFNHDLSGRQSSVIDRLNRTTLYYYDERGNVTSEVDALGHISTYTYDEFDNQLSQTNALGYTSAGTYDDRYNQLTQTDELGNVTQFSYNPRGQELTITDALGNQYQNTYDTYGNLLSIEDPDGNLSGQNINAMGLVSLRRDAEGNETTYTYDSSGNVLTETDAENHSVVNVYDANNNKTRQTLTRTDNGTVKTEVTNYYYSGVNRPFYTRNAHGRTVTHEYDKNSREVQTTDELGRKTQMTYDAYGRLLETTYPDGTTESNTYDVEGNLLSETDRKGRTTSYDYDALNRLTVTSYPDNNTTETVYDAIGQVIEEINERGNSTTHAYDAAGRRTSTTDALNNETTFEYDANGNLIKQTDAKGQVTAYVYNDLDQRTQTIFDDGSTIDTVYDKLGRQIETIDQNGRSTHYAYDGLGRLISVTDALDQVTSYTYDEVGNKTSQTDAEGRTTTWTYDALGRELSRTLPLEQVEDFTYDAVGNQTVHRDFNGDRHTFGYESDTDRLNQENRIDGSSVSYTYDTTGLRLSATDSLGDYSYTYDDRDRLIRETKPDGSTLEYTYDAAGNKLSLTSTVNGTLTETTYTYDALNRLKTVTDAGGTTTYHYDEVGNRSAIDYSNGTRTEYTYESVNRLTQVLHKDVLDNTLASFDYTLDATGRRTRIVEANGRTTDYTYDELYRLISETITDPINGNYTATYDYDKVGNRTYSTINGVQTAYTYDDNDRLTQQGGTTYTYDDNGNTLSESIDADQTTYQWDSKNRLIESIATMSFGSTTSTFAYDIDDNRVEKTIDDNGNYSTIAYIVDNNQDYAQVIHEVDSTTLNTEVTYTFGDDLLSQNRAGQSQTYHYDGLGSTRLLTDVTGNTTDIYNYEAFGDLLSQSGFSENNYLFTGEQYDDELDQYYLRARYYDQGVGRFTSQDTWMGNSSNPLTLNKYLYANVDPVGNIDPSGKFSLASIGATLDIRSTLAQAQVEVGLSLLDGALDPDNASSNRGNDLLLGVASLGGPSSFRLLRLLSSKFRRACSANSFDGETLVATEFGQIPIADIRIGDKVWAYNEETGEKSLQAVVHLIQGEGQKELIKITLDSGEEIAATAGHPFYLPQEKQWLDADVLNANDVLLSLTDTTPLISDVEAYSQIAKVYNLTVANDHTYYVGDPGVLSHNAGKCRALSGIDMEHLKYGSRNGGWHMRPSGISYANGYKLHSVKLAPKTNKDPYVLLVKTPSGKVKESSFFPNSWSEDKVRSAIHETYLKHSIEKGGLHKGRNILESDYGFKIEMHLRADGRGNLFVETAFPNLK